MKYLPEYGWEPVLISGKLDTDPGAAFRVIQTRAPHRVEDIKRKLRLNPGRGIQAQFGVPGSLINSQRSVSSRIVKAIESVVTYPDIEAGWHPWALKGARGVLESEPIDLVLSVWPIPAHMIAASLSKSYGIPWVADFPDLWSRTYAYRYGAIRRWFDQRLEKRTLQHADRLTTSSGPLSDEMTSLHGRKDIRTIVMGYDPERINEPAVPLTKTFSITYTGIFYGSERNPSKFLVGLREFLKLDSIDPNRIEVRFFGNPDAMVQQEIEMAGLTNIVRQYGSIPWEDALGKQRESQILLHLNWENPNERGAYSGKIAEYLAARRPVLSVGGFGGDVIDDLFRETGCGAYCMTSEQVVGALLAYYKQFEEDNEVPFRGDVDRIGRYSYREMAREFASVFESI